MAALRALRACTRSDYSRTNGMREISGFAFVSSNPDLPEPSRTARQLREPALSQAWPETSQYIVRWNC